MLLLLLLLLLLEAAYFVGVQPNGGGGPLPSSLHTLNTPWIIISSPKRKRCGVRSMLSSHVRKPNLEHSVRSFVRSLLSFFSSSFVLFCFRAENPIDTVWRRTRSP
uniref:Putative secreted peptide n=1 Tax=Anopheles braziliensis TaxID=58242 RepID=A0A2M3ZQB6_9DIPT